MKSLPKVDTRTDAVALGGGLDLISSPFAAQRGTLRYASNYEAVVTGNAGYTRVGGYERFDGRFRPSDASYFASVPAVAFTGINVGDTVTGGTSGVTGKCIYISAAGWMALTLMTGVFTVGENLLTAAVVRGVHASSAPSVDGFTDNTINKLAAAEYRALITQVPGSGPVRGVAILGGGVYAWRNNAGGTALAIYKASVAGWVAVSLNNQVSFTAGTSVYAEGSALTQGGVTATVLRVVLESGVWGSTAAGRLIIGAPSGGNFAAGAAAGGGACTLSGVQTAIALAPGGRVEYDVFNFTGSTATKRIYGCDGVNPEFEFDGTVLVPITTGMGSIRATFVKCHKNYLFFSYLGSLQKSAVGAPYQWSAVLGATELATGDTITGLLSVGGSETNAALMVFCQDSMYVLYGTDTTTFKLTPLSFEAGANAYSVQDIGQPMAHDTPGFRVYKPVQSYGNFVWEIASKAVEPLVKQQVPQCSVFVKSLGRYRVFFKDGSAISGTQWNSPDSYNAYTPPPSPGYAWMPFTLLHTVNVATSAEVAGVTRTFYGTADGYVMEADVGRSFDGQAISCGMKLSALHQKSPVTIKQYRRLEYEGVGLSAFTLSATGEFTGANPDAGLNAVATFTQLPAYGNALVWGGANWGAANWGAGEQSRKRFSEPGQGVSIAPIFGSSSDSELPHTLKSVFVHYTPRRLAR